MEGDSIICVKQIRLLPMRYGCKVYFENKEETGSWAFYEEERLLTIEFACNPSVPMRHHAFKTLDTKAGVFKLLENTDDIYNMPLESRVYRKTEEAEDES